MGVTKDEFFKYIGDEDSLSGYSRSYKLVLYKILIEDILYKRKSYVTKVVEEFRQFYINRKKLGKIADKDVDIKIANIESSTLEQVKTIIMVNPYKHIHENGYLHIWQDDKQNEYFVFDTVLMRTITNGEWLYLLTNIRKKIDLYFSRIDGTTETDLIGETGTQNAPNIEGKGLVHVDFSDISSLVEKDYLPAVLIIDNFILKLNSWEELFRILFYFFGKTTAGNEYFTSICDEYIFGIGKRISKNDALLSNPCKFSKNMYVECLKTIKPVSLFDTYKYASLNLNFIKDIKGVVAIDFELWLCETENRSTADTDCDDLIAKLSPKGKRNKLKIVKTKNIIAYINEEVLSDAEKFYVRIEKEYDKKILLGDIIISADEGNILKQYMASELLRLDNYGTSFKPLRKKVFAFGLVRYAMKYYSEGTFWPFFKDEYGVAVKVNNQHEIHDWFSIIMRGTGKTYDESLPQKIDNISLHSFVTDKCSRQFFDYLFDFWRIELKRNIENIYGEGNGLFKELICEIKLNNSVGINNVMKHTSMALELNERSCKLRIRRFLKLMDECFWNGDVIPETGNRFNELLRKWMAIPNGKFQSEYRIKTREKGVRGQKLLSKPQLQVQFYNSKFTLRLPQQILPHCTKEEHPCWKIEADEMEPLILSAELMQGSVFLYTEETETEIPSEIIFKRINITLYSELRKFVTFSIKADEVRFFNRDGDYLDYSNSLPAGNIYCYSSVEEIPQILYKDVQRPQSDGNMFVGAYRVEKGDIFVLHNNHAVQVGEKIKEGLNDTDIVYCVKAVRDDVEYPVYSKLPKILFKVPKDSVGGVAIIISGTEKPVYKLTDYSYREFKIDDSLDETYAYIIDLNDFISKEGCYQIAINVPNSQKQYNYKLCYLDDFEFYYKDMPYIFKDTGTICFDKKLSVEIKGDKWEEFENINQLNFNFNPESSEFSSEHIEDWNLKLNYILSNETISLKFYVPVFLWKYHKDDDWSVSKPADLTLKSLPSKLYVSGPFNFSDKDKHKLFIDLKNVDNEDTDLFAESVKDEGYSVFSFGNFKSWLNQDIVKRRVKLKLNGIDYSFADIYCRSIVLGHNLISDFEAHKLYGTFDVFGDGEYTVSISRDNNIIAEDVPLIDGKFEIETDILFGIYTVRVYELFEDDSGFDSYNVEIGSYNIEIKDLKNLIQKKMALKGIRNIHGKYAPILLNEKYAIENISKTDFSKLQEQDIVCDLWRMEISDDLPMYECDITNEQGDIIKGLLVFYSRIDIKSAVLLELTKDGAISLCYDSYRHRLIPAAQANKFKRYERYKRTTILSDDLYSFIIE